MLRNKSILHAPSIASSSSLASVEYDDDDDEYMRSRECSVVCFMSTQVENSKGGLKMQDRKMEDQKMEDRKLQDKVLGRKMQE